MVGAMAYHRATTNNLRASLRWSALASYQLSRPNQPQCQLEFVSRSNCLLARGLCCGYPALNATFLRASSCLRGSRKDGRGVRCSSTTAATPFTEIASNGQKQASGSAPDTVPTFQNAIQRLQDYWASVGCSIMQSSNTEVGAGTMNPATFLRVLGPEPWNVAYVEPSVRPDDSRYGDNPNRLQRHTQFQVILKPDPGNSQELYLGSLAALGIDIRCHDVRFVEDNWESPVLGAWGLGWEVWMDGMEITQFTYFQQAGSMPLTPVSVEITYGLERILMAVQGVNHFKCIQYASGITYGEMFLENEKEMSNYYLDSATIERIQQQFDLFDAEAQMLLAKGLAIPAYDNVLKASHAFNILDARGAIGVTERARFFGRMRKLARECAQLWVKTRECLSHPLGVWAVPPLRDYPSMNAQNENCKMLGEHTFVLEIGSEELPAEDVSSAIGQFEEAINTCLKSCRLKHGRVSVFGTPRRTVIYIENLASMQSELERDVRGPPCKAAFNTEGQPTKALEGFCKKNGITRDSVFVRTEGKVDYVYATIKEKVKHTVEVLSEELPNIIKSISFPKTMRWNSEVSYSRPIRWILAMYGEMIVPFTFAMIPSGQTTRTLRNSPSPVLKVSKAEDYLTCMKEAGITLCLQERKQHILEKSTILAKSLGGSLPEKAISGLLDEVANLVEAPTPLLGSFDVAFLDLPSEVLMTVMRKHQRYFPIEDSKTGNLLPAFVAVANGNVNEVLVQKGNEAVLRARYEDAKFFYNSDISKSLADFRPQLKGILFQEKLGTMLDKSVRVERMVSDLGQLMGLNNESISIAHRAAPLAAADLATSVVTEFTSLAGTMGKHYALHGGQPLEVANAILESVLPRHSGDILPTSDAGILLSFADRLDSLVGLFNVGCQPSASADPFGLRRAAYGLVQSLVENNQSLDLQAALEVAASVQPLPVAESIVKEVLSFVTRRLEQLLIDGGANVENVRAIITQRGSNPWLAAESVKQLEVLSRTDHFKRVVAAYSRCARIVRAQIVDPSWEVNDQLFQQPEENTLWLAYKQASSPLCEGIGLDSFVKASTEMVQPLEDYFDKVFVLVDDEKLQKNRLTLLQKISQLPRGIIDFSVLQGF